MDAAKKTDRRAANYQARQRQQAANEKTEKEREKRIETYRRIETYKLEGGQTYQYQMGGWVTVGNAVGFPTSPPTPKRELVQVAVTEVIVGIRVWPMKRAFPQGYRLTAANRQLDGTVNPYEKLTAVCMKHVYDSMSMPSTDQPKTHAAPDPDCLCGIYAYKRSVSLDQTGGRPLVAGEISLWGRVIEHEDGYRAQFAYPKRLYVVDGGAEAQHIANALELTYGVPTEVWRP